MCLAIPQCVFKGHMSWRSSPRPKVPCVSGSNVLRDYRVHDVDGWTSCECLLILTFQAHLVCICGSKASNQLADKGESFLFSFLPSKLWAVISMDSQASGLVSY